MNARPGKLLDRPRNRFSTLRRAIAPILACGIYATLTQADVYTVCREGAAIVPLRESTIIMDCEDVVIEPCEYGYRATAVFELRNPTDRPVVCTMAFPVTGSPLEPGRYKDFTIERRVRRADADAWADLAFEIKRGSADPHRWESFTRPTPATLAEFSESVVWDAAWGPHETLGFRVRFGMGEPAYVRGSNGLVSGTQLTYIVSTGALWAAPIGRARITVRTSKLDSEDDEFGPRNRRLLSYPEQAVWTGETDVTWRFENWMPREEIWLRDVRWRGIAWADVPYYRYLLPNPYRGAKVLYSAATIEGLVEKELSLARTYFAERIAIPLETRKLHVLIADWLLHEIYARHGDNFWIGRGTVDGDGLLGVSKDSNGNLYHRWHGRFAPYGWHGGWYKPTHRVRTSELSATERRNANFLIAYLAELRASLPQEARDYEGPVHTPGASVPPRKRQSGPR